MHTYINASLPPPSCQLSIQVLLCYVRYCTYTKGIYNIKKSILIAYTYIGTKYFVVSNIKIRKYKWANQQKVTYFVPGCPSMC